MSNHLHLIISRKDNNSMPDIIRDFKKYTSSKILKTIHNEPESRRNWMLWIFENAGRKNPNNKSYQLWRQDNYPEELITNEFIDQNVNYIQNNILETGIVENPEDYLYCSAKDYAGEKGLLDVEILE